MDIHKPKPWHGLREFLKEYAIIVVGVLTALAAEQTVEWLHWQERTNQTEANLRSELHFAALQATASLAMQDCLNEMLNRLETSLAASGDDWTSPYVFAVGGVRGVMEAPKGTWTSQAWRNAQADGTANHFAQKEALAFGEIYEAAARLRMLGDQEETDSGELNSLATVRRLDTGTRAQYLRLVWRLRQDLLGQRYMAQSLLDQAADLKVPKARIEEYTPQAWANYQRMCREFRSGRAVITLN
jgi:hypothetical protein